MQRVLNCKITRYVDGALKGLFLFDDPAGASNWDMNDAWAQQVIIQNVTSSQMNHIGLRSPWKVCMLRWSILTTTRHIRLSIISRPFSMRQRDCLNKFPNTEFHVYNTRFKSIISASLPLSWQSYLEPYNGNANDPHDPDPKRQYYPGDEPDERRSQHIPQSLHRGHRKQTEPVLQPLQVSWALDKLVSQKSRKQMLQLWQD
jgi:hypothetical protein